MNLNIELKKKYRTLSRYSWIIHVSFGIILSGVFVSHILKIQNIIITFISLVPAGNYTFKSEKTPQVERPE